MGIWGRPTGPRRTSARRSTPRPASRLDWSRQQAKQVVGIRMEPRAQGDARQVSEAKNGNAPTEHLLALKGVSKSFGPVQALSDVDFEVEAGEVVALVGDNGAGKSTLVKTIAGIHPAD